MAAQPTTTKNTNKDNLLKTYWTDRGFIAHSCTIA